VSSQARPARLGHALIPVIFLIAVLGTNVLALGGTPHIPLVLGAAVAAIVGARLGHSWRELELGLLKGIHHGLQACLILLVVGVLIGTWIAGGIVPAMIVYGLKVVSPGLFLVSAALLSAIVSLATGSSWSTAGTVGIALIGVGQGLGVPLPMVAGAIVSGAYLGDKMSPLSDTTNLAPAVAGTTLFEHIRHMAWTTGPSFALALIAFLVIGLTTQGGAADLAAIDAMTRTIEARFVIHPVLLVPPLLVIAMVIFRLPALPALLGGAILGALCALFVQHAPLADVMSAGQAGFVSRTGVAAVDDLLSRGGMEGMYETVALILSALAFGGVMEAAGMLEAIAAAILRAAKGRGGLVVSTLLTSISMNVIAPDQYLSIVVPGRMYADAYRRMGLHPKNLSRCLEDSGTLSSPLVPWNTCGAFMGATLGVSPLAYLPWAFLNLLNPVISATYGFTGWTMAPAEPAAVGAEDPPPAA